MAHKNMNLNRLSSRVVGLHPDKLNIKPVLNAGLVRAPAITGDLL
jgi:hypothetical protein